MTYFSPNIADNLENYYRLNFIKPKSFIQYLYFHLYKMEKTLDKKIQAKPNQNIEAVFSSVFDHIRRSIFNETNIKIKHLRDNLFDELLLLIGILIQKFSKEINLIVRLILFGVDLYFSLKESDINEKLEYSYDQLIKSISSWLNIECNESLLINYGIVDRPKEEIEQYENKLKHFQANLNKEKENSDNDGESSSDEYELDSRFQNRKDIMNNMENMNISSYFGVTNEYIIYFKLLELDTNANPVYHDYYQRILKQFEKRINTRLRINLDETIKFRTMFDFRKFGKQKADFERITDSRINKKLIDAQNPSDLRQLCESLKERNEKKQSFLFNYIDSLLSAKWPKRTDQISQEQDRINELEFMLKYHSFLPLIETHFVYDKLNQSLPLHSGTWLPRYNNALHVFANTINNLVAGKEVIKVIKILNENSVEMMKLAKFIIEKRIVSYSLNESNYQFLGHLIQMRMRECIEFENYRAELKAFIQFCSYFKEIDVSSYDKQLETLQRTQNLDGIVKLDSVCSIFAFETMQNIVKSQQADSLRTILPNITHFPNINTEKMKVIKQINRLDRSCCIIFDSFFQDSCTKFSNEYRTRLNIERVIGEVWPLTYNRWKSISTNIEHGKIRLLEINEILKKYFDNNYNKMQAELIYMNGYFAIGKLEHRNEQIKLFNKFKMCYNAALEIEDIRVKLSLKRKFPELNDFLNINSEAFKEWTLERMDASMKNTLEILDRINEEKKLSCLRAYSLSLALVEWLRKNAPSLSELKFLVDLASMTSVGGGNETAQSVDKTIFAKTLKEAGSAFASLIYELKQDSDFHHFLDLCEKVCSHLESDENIADKLLGIKDQVPLLEEIKKMKGNVELNSLKQAKQLNQYGVYTIEKKARKSDDLLSEFEYETNIADLITVDVDKEHDKNARKYKFDDLKELQNILMLVAPRKAKEKLERKADEMETDQITQDEDDQDESETLEYFIEIFSGVIRLAEIYLKLIKYGCLFFENFSVKVYCDFSDIRNASKNKPCLVVSNLNNFFGNSKSAQDIENKQDKTTNSLNDLCLLLECTFEIWCSYVNGLRDEFNCLNYFSINQIKFLYINLNKIVVADADKSKLNENSFEFQVISSILFNLTETLSIPKISKAYTQSQTLANNQSSFSTDQLDKMLKNSNKIMSNQIFYDQFKSLWYGFIQEQNSINTKNKYMSLKHLALLLNQLDRDESETRTQVNRKIPGYLNNKGQPNLIVCPSRDQVSIVLSMYAYYPEARMPTNDEILFCDAHTSNEEVENFVRLAYKSNGNKIYTIMNIQELTYENSNKIEKFLFNNSIKKTENFILVFVCCREKQSQSIIASLYAKNRVKPIIMPPNELETYLYAKFVLSKNDYDAKKLSLCSYDPDFSSVRAFLSQRSGNGKSTYIKHLVDKITQKYKENFDYEVIRIKASKLNIDTEIKKLITKKQDSFKSKSKNQPTIYHIDIAYEVFQNVDYYLFSLLICCYLKHSNGLVWRRSKANDVYLIETTPAYFNLEISKKMNQLNGNANPNKLIALHSMLNYLPKVEFRTPDKYLYDLINDSLNEHNLKDNMFSLFYKQEKYQRIAYYLKRVEEIRKNSNNAHQPGSFISYDQSESQKLNEKYDPSVVINELDCLNTILSCSELKDPNWHELNNFVNFLNTQLNMAENSNFILQIPGLKGLCVQLIIIMANDFGMSSLNTVNDDTNETSNQANNNQFQLARQDSMGTFEFTSDNQIQIAISRFEINENRKWENMIHPYIIMNTDSETITFIGVYLNRNTKQLVNPNTGEVLTKINPKIPKIDSALFIRMLEQRLPIFDNFNEQIREKKLMSLCRVMSLAENSQIGRDTDPTYELTMDNCLKMMVIFLRLACDIPVVIMGETGCGKTRLIQFFTNLHRGELNKNLLHVKIHGGTTADDIKKKLKEAVKLSRDNYAKLPSRTYRYKPITAVLFFDEANTTEEVGLIKEIMCDLTYEGVKIDIEHGLKIIAAVNPYRKHTQQMIEKLESAGLGFYVSTSDTKEKLGHIPMRQLVYRFVFIFFINLFII